MTQISRIEPTGKNRKRKLRVAAYARVSTDSGEQLTSLKAQKEYYTKLISSDPQWEFAGVYYDEGISGTKMAHRDGLLRMLSDCEKGKIDYILVKSISRFSRNTLDSLQMIRKLCSMGVYLYFEKEKIDTGKMESELLLSILSGLAENESRSTGGNLSWTIQKRFRDGTYIIPCPPYAYKNVNGVLTVDEEKAPVVRRIYSEILAGKTTTCVAGRLNSDGIPSPRGRKWSSTSICMIIRNEKYIGDTLLQKTFTDDSFTRHKNCGEKDQIYIKDHHEPIVDRETYEKANRVIGFNAAEKGVESGTHKYLNRNALSGRIICGECGGKWKHRFINGIPYYACSTHLVNVMTCRQLTVRADAIEAAFMTMMNKLTYAKKQILDPLQGRLTASDDKDSVRLDEIETALEKCLERKQNANMFYSKGFLDNSVYSEEMISIADEETTLKKERKKILKRISNTPDREKALTALMKYASKGISITEYDEHLLDEHVDHIVIYSRDELGFVMKCGPEFRERMVCDETFTIRL